MSLVNPAVKRYSFHCFSLSLSSKNHATFFSLCAHDSYVLLTVALQTHPKGCSFDGRGLADMRKGRVCTHANVELAYMQRFTSLGRLRATDAHLERDPTHYITTSETSMHLRERLDRCEDAPLSNQGLANGLNLLVLVPVKLLIELCTQLHEAR